MIEQWSIHCKLDWYLIRSEGLKASIKTSQNNPQMKKQKNLLIHLKIILYKSISPFKVGKNYKLCQIKCDEQREIEYLQLCCM